MQWTSTTDTFLFTFRHASFRLPPVVVWQSSFPCQRNSSGVTPLRWRIHRHQDRRRSTVLKVTLVAELISSSVYSLSSDSLEVVLRRAGDLAFLFQNYEFAYNCYHAAKRDLSRDQAPTFYAGVLVRAMRLLIVMKSINRLDCLVGNVCDGEFYARISSVEELSRTIHGWCYRCLLAGLQVDKEHHPESRTKHISRTWSWFRLPIFATRTVLMSTEILKSKELYDQAVQQFLKLAQEVLEHRFLPVSPTTEFFTFA